MPRYTPSQLRWSEQAQRYVLSVDGQTSPHALNSEWLEQIASFSFHSRGGIHYTVRKQRAQRGGSYWYAYRRQHGRIVKRYLSKTADLTVARLEEIARLLESASDPRQSAFVPAQAVPLPQSLPLLFSKLSPPHLPASLLDRSRLFSLLDAGQEYPFTLLSASAGFGKTTLLCQWMAARCTTSAFPPVAWLSLEPADNDPLRFWRYFIAACQKFQVDLQEVHSALRAVTPQPPFMPSSLEPLLTTLLNALAQSSSRAILVLEDYHAITAPEIHETLSFFLDHLPPALHLIMITRSDPPLSLAQLRARSRLYEIRTADLRFSQEETAILLHRSLPFPLQASTIQRLHTQLQGWGAGLHLIELALQRATTSSEAEQTLVLFPQNSTPLQEYVVNEVLDQQPASVQRFLLQTSFLARLTASLCDAVTGQHNSQEMLTLLEHDNLFLERLDATFLHPTQDSPQWYRYHALFAEAMRAEARRRFAEDQLQRLSIRASRWYEMHDFLHEAIDAALSAQDYERAATLIARSIEEHTFPGEIYEPHTLQRWLEQLPEAMLKQHPILCLGYAMTLLFQCASWQPDTLAFPLLEELLAIAKRGFHTENDLPKLARVLAFRSLLALRAGDTQTAINDAEHALALLPQTQRLWRGFCLSILGEKWVQIGDFRQAHATFLEAYTLCEAVNNDFFACVALAKLAQVSFEQGEIPQALSSFRQALAKTQQKEQASILTHWRCVALLGLATLCYDCNELEDAYRYAQEVVAISQSRRLLHHEVHAALILARVQQAQGQVFVAQQDLVALLERVPVSSPHLLQEIQAAQARLSLSVDDKVTVQRWATNRTSHGDRLRDGAEELLLARWLRTQGELQKASRLLERLFAAAQKMGYARHLLEIQVEMVLVAAAEKRKTEAQHMLRAVLAQAFARNAQRLFLDAGEPMADALRSLLPQLREQPLRAFVRSLLSAFPDQQREGSQASLVEPLSPQEMRVLRLLARHHSNAEIANSLVVSINTVRTQVQSIYRKLGVHTRTAAGEVARELHLL